MRVRLVAPQVKARPSSRPQECPHCHSPILHIHQRVNKQLIDTKFQKVKALRYKCAECDRTFRCYPEGVGRKLQSQRLQVIAVILWGLGLSLEGASAALEAMEAGIGKTTVWRDVQEAGQALRGKRRWPGKVRVIGVDETAFKVRGEVVIVGFVVDGKGELIGFDLLLGRDGSSFVKWLRGYVEGLGVEVVVRDDLGTYQTVLEQLPLDGGERLVDWELALVKEGREARKLKELVVDLGERWREMTCFLGREGVPSTNNACERAIGRSKIRYKTMRGYKSVGGLLNGIALTQWLGSGARELRLEGLLAA